MAPYITVKNVAPQAIAYLGPIGNTTPILLSVTTEG